MTRRDVRGRTTLARLFELLFFYIYLRVDFFLFLLSVGCRSVFVVIFIQRAQPVTRRGVRGRTTLARFFERFFFYIDLRVDFFLFLLSVGDVLIPDMPLPTRATTQRKLRRFTVVGPLTRTPRVRVFVRELVATTETLEKTAFVAE